MNTHSYTKDDGTHVVHYAKRDAQEHHMIPRQLRDHSMVRSSAYNIEGESNLMFLPTGRSGMGSNPEGHSIHLGSHPDYTAKIERQFDNSYARAELDNYTKQERLQQVQDTALQAQSWLTQRDEYGDAFRMNARQDRWDQSMAASSSHNQGNAESATYSPPEGVELDRTHIVGLDVNSTLRIAFKGCSKHLPLGRVKQLAHEIDQIIRKQNTPWMSFTSIQNRYMVVESGCHDTYIAEAFIKLDYAMKMVDSFASHMLPYHLITEEKVQKTCDIFDALEANQMSIPDAYNALESIGFIRLEFNDARNKFGDDKYHYQEHDYPKLVHERKLDNRTFGRLCIRGRLIGLQQDKKSAAFVPYAETYIEEEAIFSNGKLHLTSDDTKHLKSMFSLLARSDDLKEAFAVVECVTILFPLIEHLIQQGKKIPFSDERLVNYRPPKTPRRVPPAIMDDDGTRGLPIYGGVELFRPKIVVKKSNYCDSYIRSSLYLVFRVHNQSEEETEMYASAISRLKDSKSDLKSAVDHPAFYEDVVRERNRMLCSNDFTWQYLGMKPATTEPKEVTVKPQEVTVLIPEPVKKEPEKQKKNSCCVVM